MAFLRTARRDRCPPGARPAAGNFVEAVDAGRGLGDGRTEGWCFHRSRASRTCRANSTEERFLDKRQTGIDSGKEDWLWCEFTPEQTEAFLTRGRDDHEQLQVAQTASGGGGRGRVSVGGFVMATSPPGAGGLLSVKDAQFQDASWRFRGPLSAGRRGLERGVRPDQSGRLRTPGDSRNVAKPFTRSAQCREPRSVS